MPLVKFVNENKEIEVAEGAVLRNEALKAGIVVNCGINGYGDAVCKVMNCHGLGMCGTCRVLVTKGMEHTNKMTRREWAKFKTPVSFPPDPTACLAYIGNEETMRLACMTKVFGDIEVVTAPEVNLFGENFFS